jgi:hypothetical protein
MAGREQRDETCGRIDVLMSAASQNMPHVGRATWSQYFNKNTIHDNFDTTADLCGDITDNWLAVDAGTSEAVQDHVSSASAVLWRTHPAPLHDYSSVRKMLRLP